VGQVAVGSVLWRQGGALHCTAIVKATFQLPERGLMARINTTPIARTDDYLHGLPSLAAGCEIAPRMTRAEVTVVGHAYAERPDTTKRSVRLMVVRSDQVLIDKMLYVYGEWGRDGKAKAFDKMHVGYERALGGLGHPENPIGIAIDHAAMRSPNIIDPRGADSRVGGYGPIPSRFPKRRRLRGTVPVELIEQGIADYPQDFDWDYFQAAPLDQQLPQIRGDEWLMLEGMHPRHPRIHARLPRVQAHGVIYSRQHVGAPETVALVPSQLHVEPDFDRCSIVWRGSFPIASELAADQLVIAGAVQLDREAVHWPRSYAEVEPYASPAPAPHQVAGRVADDLQATAFVARIPQPPPRSLGLGYRLGERRLELEPGARGEFSDPPNDNPPLIPPSEVPPAPPSYAVITGVDGPRAPRLPHDLMTPAATAAAPPLAAPRGPSPSPEGGADLYTTDPMANPDRDAAEDAGIAANDGTELVELEDADLELVEPDK
jgi:hypothetical protein